MSLIDAFDRFPYMSEVLRRTVYRNGYRVGTELYFDPDWGLSAANKAATVDAMREMGYATHKWTLTEQGLSVACRLTS